MANFWYLETQYKSSGVTLTNILIHTGYSICQSSRLCKGGELGYGRFDGIGNTRAI